MGIIDSLKKIWTPKPLTPEQKRAKYLIDRHRLIKDTSQPNTYWLNDQNYVRFDPSDLISMERAEKVIQEFYRNPRVLSGTRRQQTVSTAPTSRRSPQRGYDEWKDVRDLGAGFEGLQDFMTEDLDIDKALYGRSGRGRR